MNENRRAQRRRVLEDGVVQANGLGAVCTVRIISSTGALLITNTEETREQLTLVIISENLVKKYKVVWRDGTKMGVTSV